jgi:integrase
MAYASRTINRSRVLQADEVSAVVGDLKVRLGRRKGRSQTLQLNLLVFRLSCCCGLRRKEIAGLQMRDVIVVGPRPYIDIRADNTKAGRDGKCRARRVPLWWSARTRDDLFAWYSQRVADGARGSDPFLCSMRKGYVGQPLAWAKLPGYWDTAIKCLGVDRVAQLSIHTGRHSFISHALAAGRSLGEVRDAAGHSNIATTDVYIHALDTQGVPDVFGC